MAPTDHDARLPLNSRRAISTFGLSVLGLLTANLLPFMVIALEQSVGLGVTEAGAVMTGCLLATAVACVATTRLAEGSRRIAVARAGLALSAVMFAVAAFNVSDLVTVLAVILGGAGAGGALSASGAALAALRNPNRMSAANGLVNRAVVTVVLAVVPLIGITTGSVFGIVAGASVALLFAASWLPKAPIRDHEADAAARAARRAKPADARTDRKVTVAGIALLVMYALWAISEDSVWALAGIMGAEQSALSDAGLGLVLSASSAGGLVATIALTFIGEKLGRAVPLAVLLVAGGALKLVAALTTDPTVYTIALIAWNTAYIAVFLLFIATAAALDANGRFSGPAIGVYLFGSSFSPVFGGWLSETFGYPGFGWVIAVVSWLLVIPMVIVARISTRVESRVSALEHSSILNEEAAR
ncbi:MFS transporter [Microbacterium sp. W4I20]|uniref:MFS transporter n=1 Tax=Microbacterium sp. W4I20 TaxID=3042262 RepID=UPI00277DF80D|nr:MFS transporter [Microbacterium sp. W4I20]MDQ0728814.1 DHA1 family inner membrane transport protein [Microbacterium sp. W4I20]